MPNVNPKEVEGGSVAEAVQSGRWSDGIAVIGMSARFPRSRNVQEFWARIMAGESLISDFTEQELRTAGVDQSTLASRDYVRRGSTIEEAERFDAKFFGYSKRDAEIMDPQQRVFLESAWEALEHAGYTGDGERVGVYAGVGINTYFHYLLSNPAVLSSSGAYQLMLGNDKDFMATRVAYKMNLRGPAVVVQTACSTSLAAVHLACQGILTGECEMAIAGGVSISFPQGTGYSYIPGMILSPDGYCRPFDKDAKGTVPGCGAGVVVLKKLSQALADEDSIYAVIRGSAWNNDGSGKIGYTAPSIEGQAAVIRDAQRAAGISADRIGYVEAHGTATELGDPIEVAALTEVFRESNAAAGSCVLGAVKANMGHADVAAGVAGLIKASLAIHAGTIPPTPNFRQANPDLALENGPFVVSATKMQWPDGKECWAGVSSFGIGGTNVHVVLSSAPVRPALRADGSARVFPVSARTPAALAKTREQLADSLESNPAIDLSAVSATLQMGRRAFEHRCSLVAKDVDELVLKLRAPAKAAATGQAVAGNPAIAGNVIFLFPGQGQQFVGMAAGLSRVDAAFQRIVSRGAELIQDEFGIDLASIVSGSDPSAELKEKAKETNVAQPALFLVEYALAERWRALGVEPAALLGHSLGELVAATVAGVFSFEDGLRLAAERGKLMANTPEGVMLAVMLPPEALVRHFGQDVWLAAENGPKLSVASGLPSAIEELERKLVVQRIASVRLASKNPFHTPLMAEAARGFREKVAAVKRSAPAIPWLSNVTGTWISSGDAQSPQYWANQILARVRFAKDLAVLADSPRLLLEVGPGEALIGTARSQIAKSIGIPSLGAENRRKSDDLIFLEAAAQLWQAGVNLKWGALPANGKARRIALPTYPFERERCWVEAPTAAPAIGAAPAQDAHAAAAEPAGGKRVDIASWFYAPTWQSTPPAAIALDDAGAKAVESWLVLLDRSGLGEALAARLRQAGATVVSVAASGEFAQDGESFSVDPKQRSDYERLWQEVAALGVEPRGLIDLWTMRGVETSAFDSLVLLLQTARARRQRFDRIEIVADRLEQILDEPIEDVERAEVFGLARVIPHEFPGTQCRNIDVDAASADKSRLVEQIAAEIRVPGGGLTVAYRGATRWQKQWSPAPLRKPTSLSFKMGGIYVLTGGIGGIGFVLARHLLREYQARVVLTGRTRLLPREEWNGWLAAHPGADGTSSKIRRMQEIEQLGGEVTFLTADVTDRAAMSAAIEWTRKRYGRIDGVVHAAGLSDVAMIASIDLAQAAELRRPKMAGSVLLAQLLKGSDLDFFLLCSSISTVQPASGQGAYAAANAFQNYFAAYCRQAYGLPAVAIAFDSWREVGMAAETVLPEGFEHLREAFETVKEAQMRAAISPDEGIDVIQRVLAGWPGPQILTSTVGLETLEAQEVAATPSHAATPAGEALTAPMPAQDADVDAVVEIWRDLLATPDIGAADNFFEMGGHSLLGTMVLSRIRDRFGVVLTLRTLFEAPTPKALAERIRISIAQQPQAEAVAASPEEREEFEI